MAQFTISDLKRQLQAENMIIQRAVTRVREDNTVRQTSADRQRFDDNSSKARSTHQKAFSAYASDPQKCKQILKEGHDAYADLLSTFKFAKDPDGVRACEEAIALIEEFLKVGFKLVDNASKRATAKKK